MYNIRKLEIDDYDKNYVNLLNQLSDGTVIDKKEFMEIFPKLPHNIYVIENLITNNIIATGTLVIEQKIIHNGGKVGHIEDIVIDENHRENGYGKIIINKLIKVAKDNNCYKVLLNCTNDLVSYYTKFGFSVKNNSMSIYFSE